MISGNFLLIKMGVHLKVIPPILLSLSKVLRKLSINPLSAKASAE